MMDIVFISYDEPNADNNWEHLLELAPNAIRIHGIKGIANAHIEAAKKVNTSYFFTVDGDNLVNEKFNWTKIINFKRQDNFIHIWPCNNPVNGLVYGYGGIKLWPTTHIKNIKEYSVDFTTSVAEKGLVVQNKVGSTTYFNTSPYNAWKSGFREAAKLSSEIIHNQDSETFNRLKIWTSIGADIEYGLYAILGARQGALYGLSFKTDKKELSKINDFEWCMQMFDASQINENVLEHIDFKGKLLKKQHDINVCLLTKEESKSFKSTMEK